MLHYPETQVGMLSATAMIKVLMNESAKGMTLALTLIGDKNKAKIKGLGQYITTGQMMDTIRLAKEFNMTKRVILLLKSL